MKTLTPKQFKKWADNICKQANFLLDNQCIQNTDSLKRYAVYTFTQKKIQSV